MSKYAEKAKKIITDNIYLTISTTDGNTPWVAPLFYCVDEAFNFYFISQLESLHIKHILINPRAAFAILDSHQKEGTGNGVQGSGTVRQVPDEQLIEGLKWYKTTFIDLTPENLKPPAPYRLFKIISKTFFILDPEAVVDKRVEVTLK